MKKIRSHVLLPVTGTRVYPSCCKKGLYRCTEQGDLKKPQKTNPKPIQRWLQLTGSVEDGPVLCLVIDGKKERPGHAMHAEEHTVSDSHVALCICFLVLTDIFGPIAGQKTVGLIVA